MIEDIATDVSEKLNNSTPSNDFDGLVGMESQMTKMGPLLQQDSDEVRTIGILGPSGIGKTTIARYLYNRLSPKFHYSVFMESIKTIETSSDNYNVKLALLEQFISKLTNEVDIKIPHQGIAKDRLKGKKILVVLDDVKKSVQLEAMANKNWFAPGSQIIITTQDQKILTSGGVEHIYKVGLPSDDEALQMFCMYAFGQKLPKDGFKELASEVTRLVGRLPLVLRVMGSHFRGMCKEKWIKALPSLQIYLDRDGEIMSILKFSYDALCDDAKRLFLHIACFFNKEIVGVVEGCRASCFLDVAQGLQVLVEKSLIDVFTERITMHAWLVQLGRNIVREQSVYEPGKRQYLNDADDIGGVLNDDKAGSSSVLGISNVYGKITCTSERAFEGMSNLQFLRILSDGINPRSLNSISGKLRFLSWWKFGMTCFPSSFNPKFLVNLDMQYSKLEKLWEETQQLSNLKRMNLSFSKRLKELPDLSSATNLYDLNLEGCSSLVKLTSSIGNATNLQKLDLSHCSSLVELPSSIGNAVYLETLVLRCCSSLVELPSSMRNLRELSDLNLVGCSKLEVVLANINLESLLTLNLWGCSLLKSDTESSTNIQDLNPSGTTVTEAPSSITIQPHLCKSELGEIQELGPWIGRISCLGVLSLFGMKNMVSLPQLPYSVARLEADNCESLERLDCSFLNPDISLSFNNCFKLNKEARDLIIHTPTKQSAVLPGGEVPECFTYRSSGGTLPVKLNESTSTKFKACIISANEIEDPHTRVSCSITSKENSLTCSKFIGNFFLDHLYTFEVEAEEVTSTELVFEFEIYTTRYENYLDVHLKTYEIKECGIFQILEVPSTELVFESDINVEPETLDYDVEWQIKERGILQFLLDEDCESFRGSDEDYEPSDIEI